MTEEICKLLDIMDGTRGLPKLKALHDMAELSLLDAAADAQKQLDKRREEEAAAKAEADEAARLELEKEREAEEEANQVNQASVAKTEQETEHARRA